MTTYVDPVTGQILPTTNPRWPAGAIPAAAGQQTAGPQTAPSVPSTATSLVNPFGAKCTIHVAGGTVSAIAIGTPGAEVATGLTSGTFRLGVGQAIKLTYTVAPGWTWFSE